MITEEIKEKNYQLFIKKLNELGVNTEGFEKIQKNLVNATFAMTAENNLAYDGSLLNTILRVFTPIAIKLNDILPENVKVQQDTLIKVCLLHQISKAVMFEPTTEEWQIKKGILYKYTKNDYALKMGMRSLYLLQDMGIKLTENELEAILILDRSADDEQAKFFASPLATIIKQANELVNVINRSSKHE